MKLTNTIHSNIILHSTGVTAGTWARIIHRSIHGHHTQVHSRSTWKSSAVFVWHWRIHRYLHMTHYAQVHSRATWVSSTVFMTLTYTYIFTHDSICTGLLTGDWGIQYRIDVKLTNTHVFRLIMRRSVNGELEHPVPANVVDRRIYAQKQIHQTDYVKLTNPCIWGWLIHTCIRITMRRSVHGLLWHPVPANVVDRCILRNAATLFRAVQSFYSQGLCHPPEPHGTLLTKKKLQKKKNSK